MLKLLTVALVVYLTAPAPAHAGFIAGAIAAIGGWLAAPGIVGFLANTALSLLASTVVSLLAAGRREQQDVFRELQAPESLPVYRFVYGRGWAAGTPAPVRVVGSRIYACFILNSRPSVGPFTVYLDKREVEVTGDPYDFTGPGAQATNDPFGPGVAGPHTWYWISRGDQISPPDEFLSEAAEFYLPTDGWQGRTVLWIVFRAGHEDDFADRWPSAPPEVFVDGTWTKVWDPRDPAQDPNDEATWQWSNNQALCVLDALRMNPVRPYPLEHIWLDSFIWSADVANEQIPVAAGGSIAKFRVDGTLTFQEGAEIEDQVTPLLAAGASRWLRAFGQLGMLPAVWQPPVGTISDVLDESDFVFERWRDGDELYTEAYATFQHPERNYETATSPTYKVLGAESEDLTGPRPLKLNLPFVQDWRRAQYISKIEVMRTRMQKSVSMVAPPDSVNFIAGANINLNFPAPYQSRNGRYSIEDMSPAEDPLGMGGGVAFRVPMTVRESAPEVFTWSVSEEQAMPDESFDTGLTRPEPPTQLSVASGALVAIRSGSATLPRILFTFTESPTARVAEYEWEIEVPQGGNRVWTSGGTIRHSQAEIATTISDYSEVLSQGEEYRIRVRARAGYGNNGWGTTSTWVTSALIAADVGASGAPPPTPISATNVPGTGIEITYHTPNDPDFSHMEFYGSNTNDTATAVRIFGPNYPGADTDITRTETGLTDGQTRYYWARSFDNSGFVSGFSAVMSATYTEV